MVTTVSTPVGGTTSPGNCTIEITSGTYLEITIRIATLLVGRLFNINFFVLGYTIDAQGVASVLLRYVTIPP